MDGVTLGVLVDGWLLGTSVSADSKPITAVPESILFTVILIPSVVKDSPSVNKGEIRIVSFVPSCVWTRTLFFDVPVFIWGLSCKLNEM